MRSHLAANLGKNWKSVLCFMLFKIVSTLCIYFIRGSTELIFFYNWPLHGDFFLTENPFSALTVCTWLLYAYSNVALGTNHFTSISVLFFFSPLFPYIITFPKLGSVLSNFCTSFHLCPHNMHFYWIELYRKIIKLFLLRCSEV